MHSGKSFFSTISIPGFGLTFGKPIEPVKKVDENGKDVMVAVEDADHLFVSRDNTNSLDVYFERVGMGHTIWVRSGEHSGKCFVVRPDHRVAVMCRGDQGGASRFNIRDPGNTYMKDFALEHYKNLYGLEFGRDFINFIDEGRLFLLRRVKGSSLSPWLQVLSKDLRGFFEGYPAMNKNFCFKIITTQLNPPKPFPTDTDT